MPTITGLVPSPDRPGYVIVLVDGAPFATIPAADAPLFTPEQASAPAGGGKTYERALRLLSFRARSAKELEKRLLEKGEPAAEVAAAIARLSAAGLLDDAQFAEARARAGIAGKARSPRRLEQDLAARGVAREVAGAAIRRAFAEAGTDAAGVAERAARKKMRSLAGLPPLAQRQKLYAYLARQGHAADVVRLVLRAVLDAPPPDETGDP